RPAAGGAARARRRRRPAVHGRVLRVPVRPHSLPPGAAWLVAAGGGPHVRDHGRGPPARPAAGAAAGPAARERARDRAGGLEAAAPAHAPRRLMPSFRPWTARDPLSRVAVSGPSVVL